MGEPVSGQRFHVGLDDRSAGDVAGVDHQQRGDAHAEVGQPGLAAGDRGERLVGAGPGEHLQQHLGQVHARQHSVGECAQLDQAGRVGLGRHRRQVQAPVVVEADRGVARQPVDDLGERVV
ncbi:MAG TPA: hypothetical protein VK875_00850 [Euzebyales bacterium]|nr:hypothetical protein [Euzebyales bacterium]